MYTFEQRRDALSDMVANLQRPAKDPIKRMNFLIRKHGGLASLYHSAAYETQNPPACIREHEIRADELASKWEDWRTLEAIRADSFAALARNIK